MEDGLHGAMGVVVYHVVGEHVLIEDTVTILLLSVEGVGVLVQVLDQLPVSKIHV